MPTVLTVSDTKPKDNSLWYGFLSIAGIVLLVWICSSAGRANNRDTDYPAADYHGACTVGAPLNC